MGFVVTPISFVDVAICVLESAPTMGFVIGPLACMHALLWTCLRSGDIRPTENCEQLPS